MIDCVTIGDIKLDTFITIPEASVMCAINKPDCQMCLDYGKKIPTAAFVTQIAGSAPNVSVGLVKLSLSSAVISSMGDDDTHAHAMHFLSRHGVDTSFVSANPAFRSPSAVVLNFQGESTQLVDHGARTYTLPSPFPATRAVHLSELGDGYNSLFEALVTAKQAHPFILSFNPGVVQIRENTAAFKKIIAATDILFVNVSEARKILSVVDNVPPADLLMKLRALGPTIIVMTDGQRGAYAASGDDHYFAPMFPGKRVDATGAGDAFTTGFLGAHLKGHGIRDALAYAAINAASVVGQVGPTAGLLSEEAIMQRQNTTPFTVTNL